MAAGEDSITILPTMQTGHYTISFDDIPEKSIAFAVVPPTKDRIDADTPFASDYASGWLIPDDYKEEYARAARLAGLSWVRERAEWNRINPAENDYQYDYTNNYMDILKENGIKICVAFHDSPEWAREPNSSIPHDLFKVYDFMYHAVQGIHADAWEFWNEEDAQHFLKEPVDIYAAAFKAASIAVADASPKTEKAFGGFTSTPLTNRFCELLMKNDVLHYSDAYNYHEYGGDNGNSIQNTNLEAIFSHTALKNDYDTENRASWITEAGLVLTKEDGQTELTAEQQRRQANYIVTSTVQSLAAGTNRHFWFIFPKYEERSYEFGIFSPNHQPYPAYLAEAVMTAELGCGIIKGKLKNTDVEGYIFDNGKNETCVLVSTDSTGVNFKSDADMIKTDLMGRKTVLTAADGMVTVDVSDEPIYVRGMFSPEDYDVIEYPEPQQAKDFSDADKIVVVPRYQYDNYSAVKQSCYKLDKASENVMPVEVYNFSDKEMTGSLCGTIEASAGTVNFSESEITVAPMSKTTVNAVITPGEASYDTEYNMTIGGSFGGAEISDCVAEVYYELPQDYTVTKFVSVDGKRNTTDADAWNLTNMVGGTASAVSDVNDGVKFNASFVSAGVDNWFYQYFNFKNNKTFRNSTGLSFTVTSDVDRDDVSLNVFVYGSNGMKYFLGNEPYFIEKGTRRYFIRWDKFQAHHESTGAFDFNSAAMIQVGISTASAGTVEYILSDIGTYKVD